MAKSTKTEYYTRTAKGTEKILPLPKDNLFRRPCEGRAQHIIKKPKVVKTKRERWTSGKLRHFFLDENIHANTTQWFICFDSPNRKMTPADQLDLMLQKDWTLHDLSISRERKHMVIDELNPE